MTFDPPYPTVYGNDAYTYTGGPEYLCGICGERWCVWRCTSPGCLVIHHYSEPEPVCGIMLCDHCSDGYEKQLRAAVAGVVAEARAKEKTRIAAREAQERARLIQECTAQIKELTGKLEALQSQAERDGL